MDLVPKPDQVVSAAGNLAHKLLYGGVADLRPMPRTLIDDGELREVYHYRPAAGVREKGDPVLLVTPLAAPSLCYDLRRDCSLVEHLVRDGRPTYLAEWGQVSFRNRGLGMEHWVFEAVPAAIEAASAHAGGRPVHVVGWSLGGIFAMLAAAHRPTLPIASITVLGSPVDISQVPLVAPLRPLVNLTDGRILSPIYRLLGGAPRPLVRGAFQLSSFNKVVTKPLAVATHLDDTDYLAQIEAVDRFTRQMIAYPGRTFGQLYHRFVKTNALVTGAIDLDGVDIELADVTVPVLVVAGSTDGIAPVGSVRAVLPLLTGSSEARFEIVPGGHLGMLTGRSARDSTWPVLDDWIDEWSTSQALLPPVKLSTRRARAKKAVQQVAPKKGAAKTGAPARGAADRGAAKKTASKKTASRKAAAKKSAAKKGAAEEPAKKSATKKSAAAPTPARKSSTRKTSTKKTSAKKTSAKKTAAEKATSSTVLGANPERRFGSSGSRGLAR